MTDAFIGRDHISFKNIDGRAALVFATYLESKFSRTFKRRGKYRKQRFISILAKVLVQLIEVKKTSEALEGSSSFREWDSINIVKGTISLFLSPSAYSVKCFPKAWPEDSIVRRIMTYLIEVEKITYQTVRDIVDLLLYFNIITIVDKGYKKFEVTDEFYKEQSKMISKATKENHVKSMTREQYLERAKTSQKRFNDIDENVEKSLKHKKWKVVKSDFTRISINEFSNWRFDLLFPKDLEYNGIHYSSQLNDFISMIGPLVDTHTQKSKEAYEERKSVKEKGAIIKHSLIDKNGNSSIKEGFVKKYKKVPSKDRKVEQAHFKDVNTVRQLNKDIYNTFGEDTANLLNHHRVFINDDPTHVDDNFGVPFYFNSLKGGRFSTNFHKFKRKDREVIMAHFGLVEIDYSNFNLNVLYNKEFGKNIDFDIYEKLSKHLLSKRIDPFSGTQLNESCQTVLRKDAKTLSLIAFNSEDKQSFTKSLSSFEKNSKCFVMIKSRDIEFFQKYVEVSEKLGYEYSAEKIAILKKFAYSLYASTYSCVSWSSKKAKGNFEIFFNNLMKTMNEYAEKVLYFQNHENPELHSMKPISVWKKDIVSSILYVFSDLKKYLFKPSSLFCQKIESDALILTMRKCISMKIIPFSVHDCIYVPLQYEEKFKEIVEENLKISLKNYERAEKKAIRIKSIIKSKRIKLKSIDSSTRKGYLAKLNLLKEYSKYFRENKFKNKTKNLAGLSPGWT